MKLIFLDFDGVIIHTLQSSIYWTRQKERYEAFCPISCSNLGYILDKTGAKIVVSSTWRKSRSVDELQEILKRYVPNAKVLDKTPICSSRIRGEEIFSWLKNHHILQFDRFVIIDDDSDMGKLLPHLFKINGKVGLDFFAAEKIIKYLNGTENYCFWVGLKNKYSCYVRRFYYWLYRFLGKIVDDSIL